MAFIQVARFLDVREAQIARSALEASRIPVVLADEFRAQTLWHEQMTIGGVRLYVHETDAGDARDFLAHVRSGDEDWIQFRESTLGAKGRALVTMLSFMIASWVFSWPLVALKRPSVWGRAFAVFWIASVCLVWVSVWFW